MRNWKICTGVWAASMMALSGVLSAEDLQFSRNHTTVYISGWIEWTPTVFFDDDGGAGSWSAALATLDQDGLGGEAYVTTTAMMNLGGETSAGAFDSEHDVSVQTVIDAIWSEIYAENNVLFDVSDTVVSPSQNPLTAVPVKIYFDSDWADTGLISRGWGPAMAPLDGLNTFPNREITLSMWVDSTDLTIDTTIYAGAVTAIITTSSGSEMVFGSYGINAVTGSFSIMVTHDDAHHGDDAGIYGGFRDGIGAQWQGSPSPNWFVQIDDEYGGIFGANFNLQLLNPE